MSGLPKDLLAQLNDLIDAEIKPAKTTDLAGLLGDLDKAIEEEPLTPAQQRRIKRAAKRAELAEGGRRQGAKDWVSQRVPTPVVVDTLKVTVPKRQPITPPKPVAERSDEELYVLLAERWRRYMKVVAEDKPDRKLALANATQIAELLQERGQTSEQIVAFIQSIMQ